MPEEHYTLRQPWRHGYLQALYVLALAANAETAPRLARALDALLLLWPDRDDRQLLAAALASVGPWYVSPEHGGAHGPRPPVVHWDSSRLAHCVVRLHALLHRAGRAPPPPASAADARAAFPAAVWFASPAQWGPLVWFLLHHLCHHAAPTDAPLLPLLATELAAALPCRVCREHARTTVPAEPFDLSDPGAWSWRLRERVRTERARRPVAPGAWPPTAEALAEAMQRPHLCP